MRLVFAALCAVLLGSVPAADAQTTDIVLYASDVSVIQGNWARLSSTTGAGGQKMSSADQGWSAPNAPIANPAHYFEASFDAPAGVAYRLWLRLRAAGNSKYNESVWVQFSNAVTSGGSPLWRTESTSGLLVNLEDCKDCGVGGWGWQDNAYWLGTSSIVRFGASGRQTIRVQTREDGVDLDQIVLSPSTYLNGAPGPLTDDATIVPKSGAAPGVSLLRTPYLQQVSDREAVVVWTTREPGPAEVRFGTTSALSSRAPADSRLFAATTTGLAYDFYQHEARLSGLAAATRYNYDVFMGATDATPGVVDTLRTAPAVGSGTVTFIAFGDSGVGSTQQRQLASRMAGDTFDLALHSGDVVYGSSAGIGSANYRQYDDWFFGVYAAWLRSRPVFPSIGNHDNEIAAGQAYRDVFVLPENAGGSYADHAERYYSFDYGPVHFIVLDTETAFWNTSRRQAQLDWLRADLSATAQPWKVAVFHRPPYSSGTEHGSDLTVRAAFVPIFEQHGVHLVINGHDHDYERSKPWREYAAEGEGVTYIVTGGGGAPLYTVGTNAWTAAARSAHHYIRVTAGTGCTLSVTAVNIDGSALDQGQIDRCVTPPPPTAWPVPGTIQAEDFDAGANGTAYRDQTAGNTGGQYRATDVDIERTGDTGGGYNVGWIAAGEWLTYTVTAAAAGAYTLEARVASPSGGGAMRVAFDGVDTTGAMAVPATGGWQTWTTVNRAVTLTAGSHVMKVTFDTAGFNLNYIRISPASSTPYGGTPRALPGTLQSEDFDEGGEGIAYHDTTASNSGGQYRSTGVDVERTGDTGGGYDVGWVSAGEWLNYSVTVTAGGTYQVTARVASPGAGGTFHIEADGVDVTGPLRVPATGGWQVYQNIAVPVTLNAGLQILRVVMDSNGTSGAVGNFNYLTIR